MDAEERHWTDNSELLERFVLNALNPAERNELEDHLRICEVCKQAVRRELILIAGIRRSGRERFKHELRKRLAAEEQPPIAWRSLLAAAAVVLIVLSVAIFHRWFDVAKHDEPRPMHEQPLTSTETPSSEAPEVSAPQQSHAADKAGKTVVQPPAPLSKARRQDVPTEEVKAERPATKRVMPTAPVHIAQEQEGETETLFLAGSLMAMEHDGVHRFAAADEPAALEQNVTISAPSVVAPTLLVRQVLFEQPRHTEQSKEDTTRFVLTRFERRGDTLIVTLLLPTLVDSSAMAAAHVVIPTPDSLIVTLPDRRIGYRLPASWAFSKEPRRSQR